MVSMANRLFLLPPTPPRIPPPQVVVVGDPLSFKKQKESLAKPPSRTSPSLPTPPPPRPTTSWLLLAVLWLPGHDDSVDGWLHPLCLGVEDNGGLAAVDLNSLPYLPHQGAFECSCHLELEGHLVSYSCWMMFLKMLRECIILVLSFNAVNMLVYSDIAAVTRLSPVNCFKVISMFNWADQATT